MRCIRPIKAGFQHDGTSLTFSYKNVDKQYATFEFECRKCLPCRLNIAREKAIRAFHEAQMHEDNIFLTLTYDEEHLESPRLIYQHFQKFIRDLRYRAQVKIPYMVTGEYGDKFKRPHWHALLFNYQPPDQKFKYTSDRGDTVYSSEELTKVWSRGSIEYGSITIDSANYVARYAAKKLCHGRDQDHDYHPIHKTSSKYGLGRSWIEKYHVQTFEHGYVTLPNGAHSKIPRYYVDWCRKHHPTLYEYYIQYTQPRVIREAEETERRELELYLKNRSETPFAELRKNIKLRILESKFEQLQKELKL